MWISEGESAGGETEDGRVSRRESVSIQIVGLALAGRLSGQRSPPSSPFSSNAQQKAGSGVRRESRG